MTNFLMGLEGIANNKFAKVLLHKELAGSFQN